MDVNLQTVLIYAIEILIVFFTIFYLYFARNFNYWKNLGIPYIKPRLFFGNLKEAFVQNIDIGHHLKNMYNEHKDKQYVGFFSFDRPTLLVNDLDLVKQILVKDASNFIDHNICIDDKVDPVFGKMLFSLKGDHWRRLRANLTPVFTSGKMKKMFFLVENCAKELLEHLERNITEGSPVPVKETMARYTTDVISSCAFGIESNSLKNPNAEVRMFLKKFFEYTALKGIASTFMMFAPKLQNFFGLKFLDNEATSFLKKTLWGTVEYREKNGISRGDFLHSMMEMRSGKKIEHGPDGKKSQQFTISEDEFIAQSFAFFFGGFESSGSTLAFTLYELALKPEIQIKLRKEINEVTEKYNHEVSYDAIQEMTYLDMVIAETLRLRPILGFLDRINIKDFELPDPSGKKSIKIPAGTGVYISMLGIHHNPDIFPDPLRYDPERFTEENKQNRHSFSYFPFGEGPRICIGMRFGLLQVKMGLINIVTHYEISPCKDTPVPLTYDARAFLLSTVTEIPLNFKKL